MQMDDDTQLSDKEMTLDPQDWGEMRQLAHRMVDDMLTSLEKVGERPVWQPPSGEVAAAFDQPLPSDPQGAEQAYQDFRENILPYPMGNIHPRFWGWYMGNGTVLGALGDFLAASMNPNLGGGNHVANLVERQVVDWCKQIVGFPKSASGLMTSGGSMANFVGLAVARHVKAGFDIRGEGLQGCATRMMVYSSSEVHSCLQKSVELLGLGNKAFRRIPVNPAYQVDLVKLEEAIAADRRAGYRPICVIGNAGTVNTGSIDDLNALADLCEREGLWFHVDGAIGALVPLAPRHKDLMKGLQRADSIAMDLHKWLHVPFEAGVALVCNEPDHRRAFSLTPEYLAHTERGLAGGSSWFSDYGLQLTRGFRALKAWLSIKEHGAIKLGRLIDQNIDQAHYLEEQVKATPVLELIAPVTINIVCFRFNPGGLEDEALNRLNQELLIRLHESGRVAPSYTTLNGRYCLRAAIANHRTRRADLDILVEEVVRQGQALLEEAFIA
jgi:glutamate/tyrosine decarboxylase-like PLP-dependent enzyme